MGIIPETLAGGAGSSSITWSEIGRMVLNNIGIIILFAIVIVLLFYVVISRVNWKRRVSSLRTFARNFGFKDVLNMFHGTNYTVTLCFTFLIVLSIIVGCLGLLIGTPHPEIHHSHLIVAGIIILWAVSVISLKYLIHNSIPRSVLFLLIPSC